MAGAEEYHFCSMCSYCSRTLEALNGHVCKTHKNNPRFLVYCKSCLRSFMKWDSYRKHLQRGCEIMPRRFPADVDPQASMNHDPSTSDNDSGESEVEENISVTARRQWHEATYILNLKEKHILAQVAVDKIISTTSSFVADILSGLMDDIRDCTPVDTMHILEKKVKDINDDLFKGISTAYLQNLYFKQHFNLVVSLGLGEYNIVPSSTHLFITLHSTVLLFFLALHHTTHHVSHLHYVYATGACFGHSWFQS